MVLPSSINKATGLLAAIGRRKILPSQVGIGDAENDRAFLDAYGVAATVDNIHPALRERRDVGRPRPGA